MYLMAVQLQPQYLLVMIIYPPIHLLMLRLPPAPSPRPHRSGSQSCQCTRNISWKGHHTSTIPPVPPPPFSTILPVPPSLVQKVEAGAYIEFGDLVLSHLGFEETAGSKSKQHPVTSIAEWLQTLLYMCLSSPENNLNRYLIDGLPDSHVEGQQ